MKQFWFGIGLLVGAVAHAEVATIVYPAGPQNCQFEGLQVSPDNLVLAVSGCACDSLPPTPTPPPPAPPPSGDPGHGLWTTPGGVIVFDLSASNNRTFLPGCIDGGDWERSNCEYEGGLVAGVTYAARVRVGRGARVVYKFDLGEAGEYNSEVRGALSSIPGDLQTKAPNCFFGGALQRLTLADPERAAAEGVGTIQVPSGLPPIPGLAPEPMCVVPADTQLYLNFTPANPDCGGTILCRAQLIRN